MNRRNSVLAAVGLLWWLSIVDAAAQWVTFDSLPAEALTDSNASSASGRTYPLRGYISLPAEPARHPGVVLLSSCEGRRAFHLAWAETLSELGYAALVVDDFFLHDRYDTCGDRAPVLKSRLPRRRLENALGAAAYLASRPEVDGGRLAVMGWGDAPLPELLTAALADLNQDTPFSAVIAVTPASCSKLTGGIRPLLLVSSVGDSCPQTAADSSPAVRIATPAHPGFDNARSPQYDRRTHRNTIDEVASFLKETLGTGEPMEAGWYGEQAVAVPEMGTWAVDPADPGSDLPPSGASIFDMLFTRVSADGVVHEVPYPFEALLERLDDAAAPDASGRPTVEATLVPLGRSLQREVAAPNYFASPRIVAAVTSDWGDLPVTASAPAMRVKNRLFLGYQPLANVIEVISYNPSSNRFEFQIVNDYAPGKTPDVIYARRALCMSCHQNAGPIFPDAGWDETPANRLIADRLAPLGPQFHSVEVADSDAVTVVDFATNEANLLLVYQRLWSQGCQGSTRLSRTQCRAGALQAMVQYRLSGSAGFNRDTELFKHYLSVQEQRWSSLWPDGLLIPTANLPNRAPLMSASPSVVAANLDPLRHRPPGMRWTASSTRDLERLIRGLSHELPAGQLQALSRFLNEAPRLTGSTLTATCTLNMRGRSTGQRLARIECPNAKTNAFSMGALLRLDSGGGVEGRAGWLQFGGGAYARLDVAGDWIEDSSGHYKLSLELRARDSRSTLRAPDGNAIEALELVWKPQKGTTRPASATAALTVARDFGQVASALNSMALNTGEQNPLLDTHFSGVRLLDRLLSELGIAPDHDCCESPVYPPPRLDSNVDGTEATLSMALEHRGPMQTFARYCGHCHGGDTDHPPGFLHGDGERVLESVSACAPRIYYRLSMWEVPIEQQKVPPMPPIQGLNLTDTSAEEWLRGESLERLLNYTRQRLTAEGLVAGDTLKSPYEQTRPCLPVRRH